MKVSSLTPVFTDRFPTPMEEGRLYVSMTLAIAGHLCCCGCRTEVITPLSPPEWTLTFDGETVTLDPSIGNWSFHCQSHYLITRNQVQWAPKWSRERIQLGRRRDRADRERYFAGGLSEETKGPIRVPGLKGFYTRWRDRRSSDNTRDR